MTVPPAARLRVFCTYQTEGGKTQALRLADQLRQHAISADMAFGDRKLGKQLSAADRAGADYALILGEEEIKSGTVTIKDLRNGGDQRTVAQGALLAELGHGSAE